MVEHPSHHLILYIPFTRSFIHLACIEFLQHASIVLGTGTDKKKMSEKYQQCINILVLITFVFLQVYRVDIVSVILSHDYPALQEAIVEA